jgi:hypothetical protein
MLVKTTRSLFRGIYQYKIVLVCSSASLFRSGNIEDVLEQLKTVEVGDSKKHNTYKLNSIKTQTDLVYALALANTLLNCIDIDIRVENPWISIYTNDRTLINNLAKIDKTCVKYICEPKSNAKLAADTVVMPKMNYDYRITLSKTSQPNHSFIEWAEKSTKCKLTKSCIRDLQKARSWGGTHLYVTGDNNLLMVKMHLGGNISKIERIVKN